ncbi:MAG TPA: ABC transporter ATP-binding protein [candidate division Zixibacteria bacterium]|nr:ABC transporter ATP-binding protein [candidate division Zixibacteria bacterium]MDD4916808.1 ABC transporter ATP-binding protein [candidate division Zixibacteria bacterium]MDM7973137.1 ABC transporter ATP-binding protein [candidate division Zixibacteria bacterium]HOD65190.1 ABC transporter ATP-binding protein [candidate division Zixibacteria bacterium]HPI33013.1 ABC transporter ATP-binding protein [candidate division Zixibacteria bacterium]
MRDKIRWLWRYWRHYPKVLVILLVLTPLQTALMVALPRLIGLTIDYLNTGAAPRTGAAGWLSELGRAIGLNTTAAYAVTFILFGLIAYALYAYFQSWRAWMNTRLEWHFRQEAFDGITAKGPDFFNHYRSGDLLTRMTDDVQDKLSWFACSGIFRLYEATLAVVFIVASMLTISPGLTAWTALPLPFIVVLFFRSSSLLDRRYDALQKRISDFNDVMEACFSGIRVVKAYVREQAQKVKFTGAAEERRKAEIDAVRIAAVMDSLYHYLWQFAVVIVLLAGGYRVLYADLSIGSIATFIYYATWLVFPMFDIGQFLVKSRQSAVSIDRLVELEKVPPMVADIGRLSPNGEGQGRLTFENVSFAFEGMERKILEDVSFEIAPGQTAAIVGKVGSGKSWLVNLIPRLVDPTAGTVRLDGLDLREYRLEELRRAIGFVPQEPVLFSDTIRNNIIFGREGISETLLEWAIDVARLRGEIAGFPQGLETPIGTRGVAISGGQKQRLALARALVGKPRILVLDDCTSALDSRTEAELWERLHEVMPEMTAVLITHRPDTLERADRIFVLDSGRVVEQGAHSALIDAEGDYARIYRRLQLAEAVN